MSRHAAPPPRRVRWRHSLRFKLAGLLFAAGLLPLTAVGVWHDLSIGAHMTGVLESHFEAMSVQKTELLESGLREAQRDLRGLAGIPLLVDTLRGLTVAIREDGPASEVYREVERPLRRYLEDHLDRRLTPDLLLVALDGEVVFSLVHASDFASSLSEPGLVGTGLASTFRDAVERRETVVSALVHYAPSGSWSGFIATPVYSGSDLLGVCIARFDPEVLFAAVVSTAGLGATGETLLAARDGDEVLFVTRARHADRSAFELRVPATTARALPARKALAGQTGSGVSVDYRGVEVFAAWRPLAPLGLAVVVKQDAWEAFGAIDAFQERLLWSGVFSVPFLVILALIAASLFGAPLTRLTEKIQRAALGDLEVDSGVYGRDELGELSRSFNLMAAHLRQALSDAETERWIEGALVGLSEVAQGEDISSQRLGKETLTLLCELTEADSGALYLAEEGTLRRLATHALQPDDLPEEVVLGEGVFGQAAADGKAKVLRELRGVFPPITALHGSVSPAELVIQPLNAQEGVRGAVELASSRGFRPRGLTLLARAAETLGARLVAAQNSERLRSLYEHLQRQAEELRATAGELERANVELSSNASALRRSEEELRAQRRELESANEELLAKGEALGRQNLALERSRERADEKAKQLEEVSRYRTQFLANVSHELRTPLNSLLLLAEALGGNQEGNLTEEQLEWLRIIRASGQDLLELINQTLDLARIDVGRLELRPATVLVAELADEVSSSFAHIAQSRGLQLEVSVDAAAPASIISDRARLAQIVRNLVANALKFTSEGGVRVRFLPSADARYAGGLAVAVEDDGIGIAADLHELVFEGFRHAGGAAHHPSAGAGLGLSICRELCRALGGEIALKSAPNAGSTFTLLLPARLEGIGTLDDVPAEPESAAPASAWLRRQVLVVDGDRSVRAATARALRAAGLTVGVAASLAAARKRLARETFVCLVLDLQLPDGRGLALLEAVADEERDPPAIVVHASRPPTPEEQEELAAYESVCVLKDDRSLERLVDEVGLYFRPQSVSAEPLEGVTVPEELRGRKVLIVEDDMRTMFALSKILSARGMRIAKADTGVRALRVLGQETDIAIVVMDVMMPELDGYATLRRMRAEPRLAKTPVIALTAKAMPGERERCVAAGANAYLPKPVDVDALVAEIVRLLCAEGGR